MNYLDFSQAKDFLDIDRNVDVLYYSQPFDIFGGGLVENVYFGSSASDGDEPIPMENDEPSEQKSPQHSEDDKSSLNDEPSEQKSPQHSEDDKSSSDDEPAEQKSPQRSENDKSSSDDEPAEQKSPQRSDSSSSSDDDEPVESDFEELEELEEAKLGSDEEFVNLDDVQDNVEDVPYEEIGIDASDGDVLSPSEDDGEEMADYVYDEVELAEEESDLLTELNNIINNY